MLYTSYHTRDNSQGFGLRSSFSCKKIKKGEKMTNENETHSSGLLYFMPAWIFDHPDLTNTDKLIYSLLSGLAHGHQEKECFPSDEYLGKRLGIQRQRANECVKNLEKAGALSKRIEPHEKNPFKKKRIITIYLSPQKFITKSEKSDSRRSEKSDSAKSEKSDISNKEDSIYPPNPPKGGESSKAQPPLPKNKERHIDHVLLSKEELEELKKEYGNTTVGEYIKKLDAYMGSKGKAYKSHYKTIISWIMRDKKEKKTKNLTKGNAEEWLKRNTNL